jgi:CBS domain-containing protein
MLSNKVKEIMTRDVITVEVTEGILDVMEMMVAKKVGRVIITEKQLPVGIFTEQDVLKRVVNKKLDDKKTSIKKVMTTPIHAVREDASIVEVLGKMYKGKFRHMLVHGEKNAMVGLVSMRRILKLVVELEGDHAKSGTIGSIMSSFVTVDASQSIYDAIGVMIKKNTGCVVVVSGGGPIGIFTERDVLTRVAVKNIDSSKSLVKEIMTADPISMAHSAPIADVLAEMDKRGFRNMPIRNDSGELVGIVSMADILKYAKALDVDESVRKAWKEIEEHWESEDQYTPG